MPDGNALDVLLVEDHEDVASMMIVVLDMLGHRGLRSRTVTDAIQQTKRRPFDVVLTDYSLPDGNAIDLLERLKIAAPATPVILLTGYDLNIVSPAIRAGFAGCLQKPVDVDELAAMLHAAMAAPAA
ncbi:MAG: response regulator [Tepidisphaeraceae bacterium]|jgi:DNA-binding NtrC family response regulator